MNKEETVAVCMSTFNGEKYIREQLDSIVRQSDSDIVLFIRDDGSTDFTCDIIKDYEKQYGFITFINPDERENLKPTKSFLRLIQYAFNDPREFGFLHLRIRMMYG